VGPKKMAQSQGRTQLNVVIKPGGLLALTGIVAITVCAIANVVLASRHGVPSAPSIPPAEATAPASRVSNAGFEDVAAAGGNIAEGWKPYELGYQLDSTVAHQGKRSLRCVNATHGEKRGAQFNCVLNQPTPMPVVITGWSRPAGVDGIPDSDYSLYVDVEYADGTYLYGQNAPFPIGTSSWILRRLQITPEKPIHMVSVYALFRGHGGTAWFDDFDVKEVATTVTSGAVSE